MNIEKQELCNKIWMENKDAIENYCKYKLMSYPSEASDVTADISYHLCEAIMNDKIHTNPKSWLFAVARNLVKKKYEEANIKKKCFIEYNEECIEKTENISFDEDLILDNLISDSVIESLSITILDKLSTNNQQLYHFIYNDHLKMKEIAQILNISVDAVKQRNKRLTKKIKQLVKEHIENLN